MLNEQEFTVSQFLLRPTKSVITEMNGVPCANSFFSLVELFEGRINQLGICQDIMLDLKY